jgi:colanic acid/amylovoran biosynthesis glycosyltransferase
MKQLAYFLDVFPHYSETFIKNELLAMREFAVDLHIFSVLRPARQNQFPDIAPLLAATSYLPEDYGRVTKVLALLHHFVRRPCRLWKSWRQVKSWQDPHALHHWGYSLVLAQIVQRQGIEHIHAHFANKAAELAVLVSMISGIPCSFTGHGRDVFCNRRLLQEKMAQARFVIVVADYMRDFLRQEYPEIPAAKYHKIIMGVDPAQFQVQSAPQRDPVFNIISVARLEEKKGLPYLIQALAILRAQGISMRLTLIGEGAMRAVLEPLIARLGLGDLCNLPGVLPPDEVRRALLGASLFCLPCIVAADGDRDSMPVSIKEAMAMQVPVVATHEVAIPEMVKEGAGILVPPHDAAALAEALKKVYEMTPAERTRMGVSGRRIIEQEFSIADQTGRLAELFGVHTKTGRMVA